MRSTFVPWNCFNIVYVNLVLGDRYTSEDEQPLLPKEGCVQTVVPDYQYRRPARPCRDWRSGLERIQGD